MSRLCFLRSLVGQGERWTIVKASTVGRHVEEENGSEGQFVRVGDSILLRTCAPMPTYYIGLNESVDGMDARLISADRIGTVGVWQIELHGIQALPSWSTRPYLRYVFIAHLYTRMKLLYFSGRNLFLSPAIKSVGPDVEVSTCFSWCSALRFS